MHFKDLKNLIIWLLLWLLVLSPSPASGGQDPNLVKIGNYWQSNLHQWQFISCVLFTLTGFFFFKSCVLMIPAINTQYGSNKKMDDTSIFWENSWGDVIFFLLIESLRKGEKGWHFRAGGQGRCEGAEREAGQVKREDKGKSRKWKRCERAYHRGASCILRCWCPICVLIGPWMLHFWLNSLWMQLEVKSFGPCHLHGRPRWSSWYPTKASSNPAIVTI